MRRFKWIMVGFVLVLGIIYASASWYIMGQALDADSAPIEQRPSDLGAAYQEVNFNPRGRSDIKLSGWWLAATDATATIIWQHGLDSTKDSRLEVVVGLQRAGFNVLTTDLRGHGESDPAPMGAGLDEQNDILGAIDWLTSAQGIKTDKIGLMGVSYGASIVLMTASQTPEIRAVLIDSAFAELTDMIVSEVADRTSAPNSIASLLKPGIALAAKFSRGIDVSAVAPAEAAAQLAYPIAIVHCSTDERITIDHGERIAAAAPEDSTFVVVDGCEHARASDLEGDAYIRRAAAYFNSRLGDS